MQRHDRKHLPDRPVVLDGLKHREVAQVLLRELLSHRDEVFRQQFLIPPLTERPVDLDADRPIQLFRDRLLVEVQISQFEQQPNFLPLFRRIVESFQQDR
jgi:hypothetical protein